jgi:hypothetical protein
LDADLAASASEIGELALEAGSPSKQRNTILLIQPINGGLVTSW